MSRTMRKPKHPLNNPIKIHDLSIGWQNTILLRVDDAQGHALLNLFGRNEIRDVIAALQLTLDNMERNAMLAEEFLREHPEMADVA